MPLIEWDEARLSVHIREIDEQHKWWIGIINELHESLMNSLGPETLEKTFLNVIEYTAYHFDEEEKLMERINYPQICEHVAIHSSFKSRMIELKDEFMKGGIVLRTEVMSILKNWLEHHIGEEDQKYSSALRQGGKD